mmetsp:Transcript_33278/g.38535  ORF Transcript_33278/g.38535 Transcript_33278/m.38535 type:complete len:134 (+) Transcript_33278:921-1322(+)
MIQKGLHRAKTKLNLLSQKNLGGHFGPNANPVDIRNFQENTTRLDLAGKEVTRVEGQLNESKSTDPQSSSSRRLLERLQKIKLEFDVIQGIVMRQKTISGLWIECKIYDFCYNLCMHELLVYLLSDQKAKLSF